MAKTRNVSKSLASMEDLLQGKGVVLQTRGKESVSVHRIDVPFAVDSIAEMQSLDITKYSRANVYSSENHYTSYVYDPLALSGIAPNSGAGYWVQAVVQLHLIDTVTSTVYALEVTNGVLGVVAV